MIRPGNVFHRKIEGKLPRAVKGDGAVIVDETVADTWMPAVGPSW